jgi:hypothetical protein
MLSGVVIFDTTVMLQKPKNSQKQCLSIAFMRSSSNLLSELAAIIFTSIGKLFEEIPIPLIVN